MRKGTQSHLQQQKLRMKVDCNNNLCARISRITLKNGELLWRTAIQPISNDRKCNIG